MSADDILLDVEERMEKTLDRLKHDLAGIRTGRANPGLVDSLRVEATVHSRVRGPAPASR